MSIWKRAPKSDRFFFVASCGLLVMSCLLVGMSEKRITAASQDEEFYRFVDVAAEVYSEIESKYVDEVDSKVVLESALQGMFQALDENSMYMNPDMIRSLEKDTNGEFSGIGIHITKRQGVLTVITPIPGSPAAEAGILPWDRIIEIEGESTEKMDINDAVDKLTGPTNTEVTFKIFRAGEPEALSFTLRRANVEVKSVFWQMMPDKIGYIRLSRFSSNTTRDLRKAVLDLKSQGMTGLVMDLRNNPGGLLSEAITASNLFVPKGELVVSTKGRVRSQNREYRSTEDPIVNVPLFVLVNGGSASASEILAGAIQDHRIGVIIGPSGKNSFGKGSVQTVERLVSSLEVDDDGNAKESAIRLTMAKYYTPSGRTIHHIGITPDIGIPVTLKQEAELLRHGMIGDHFTGEDYHIPDPVEPPEGLEDDGSSKIEIQTPVEETPADADSADPDKPFYDVENPAMMEKDDFVDVMLNEAMKQMKIYMILERGNKNASADTIASFFKPKGEEVAANN